MNFGGEALMSSQWEVGSGPPIAWNIQEVLIKGGTQTSDPISLRWKDLLIDEILEIAVTCHKEGWDGYDAAPISSEALSRACNLIYSAPDSIRPPEAVPSPDGEIAFEWHIGREKMMTVMPRGEELIYAAILGPNNVENGRKLLSGGWPSSIVNILLEYFPNARPTTSSRR
ncbi:MAG: hypothetical protein VST65_00095 [Nitrospirota bacterium]|nr:hypothetical protein [Nitrospirota bacterium]